MNNNPVCERAPELMAFLYDETNEQETRDVELHLQECSICREELASFGVVRESIVAWRDEALSGFVSRPLATRKSALAAFRQFFDLSPLWLKGATASAVLTFFVLAGLSVANVRKDKQVAGKMTGGVYTQQDVKRLIDEALAKQQEPRPAQKPRETVVAVNPTAERKTTRTRSTRNRRPLSRAEREQLAADLRLLPSDEDLDLLDDRINQ